MATPQAIVRFFWLMIVGFCCVSVAGLAALVLTAGGISTGVLIPMPAAAQTTKYVLFPAGALSTDTVQCDIPLEVTVGTWAKMPTVVCTDNNAATMEMTIPALPGWDAGTVTLTMIVMQDAADTANLHTDVAGRCVGGTETPAAYPAETAMDINGLTGSDAKNMVTSAALTLAGTCAAGDAIQLRVQIDATGTTTAMGTLHILGFHLTYTEA